MPETNVQKKGNILLVANYASDVGYAWWLMENFWGEISTHFSKSEVRCVLIYPEVSAIPDIICQSGIEVVEHDYSDRSVSSVLRLRQLIKMYNIKNVYLTDREYYSFIYLVLRLSGVQRIILHDHKPGEREPASGLIKLIKLTIHYMHFLSCDYYIGVSDFVRQRLIHSACIPPERCDFVLNGIPSHNDEAGVADGVRNELGIPDNAVIVVSTGRATFYKGLDFIIECARQLLVKEAAENIYFVHCGSGPDITVFQEQARDAGLGGYFIFAGHRNDIRRILLSSDIAIQASRGEAFSLSIIEYLAAGLATLAPKICGNAEAIEHGKTGILFPPGDVKYAVRWIKKFANNADIRTQFGAAARESAETKFTIERANLELLEILDEKFI